MWSQIVEVVIYLAIGAVAGFIAVRVAPAMCKRFHEFSISPRSIPLHIFSFIMFTASGVFGLLDHNYFVSTIGFCMSVLSVVALVIVNRYKNSKVNGDAVKS